MIMTLKLAWRNIWRNRRRSAVILTAIVVGLFGMVFMIAIMKGMSVDMLKTSIENGVGHIQIHEKGFNDNMNVSLNIRDPKYVGNFVEETPSVTAYAERIKARGLVSSPESSSGVEIWGVDHETEPGVSAVKNYLVEGDFLTGKKGEIYIGRSLADKLKVKKGDKIVLMGQGLATEIGAAAFRVSGIFESTSKEFDKYNIYINLTDAQDLLSMPGRVSEIVVMTESLDHVDEVTASLKRDLEVSGLEVLPWMMVIPLMHQMLELWDAFNYIVYILVIMAMAFGIVNTILMSVLERTREIGILMAIGTRPGRVFSMVMWEGFFLGLTGLIAGWVFTLLVFAVVSKTGINISIWADSLKYMGGISPIIYPVLHWNNIIGSSASVFCAALFSAVYPAVKIMRLNPVEAFRSV
ncbi:MAG: ABC transporter permease [Deltaproteobacteria bacterium]|nr:ABC transporter permease [Candidatus Zymogenaceae bacterium]